MDQPLHSSGLEWDKPRARHAVAAFTAVVLSLLLHGVVIARFPALPVGRAPQLDEPGRIRPVVLGDVRRQMSDATERPERFRAQDPDLLAAESVDAGAFRELMEDLLPAEPADLGVALTGEDRAMAEPEAETDRAPWDPRQDLVQIRERIVPDDIAALPRRLVPDVDRAARAADIVLPVESPGLELAARGESWMRAGRGGGVPGDAAEEREAAAEPASDRLDTVDALAERPEEITDVEPIEQLLDLELMRYRDPAEPDYEYFQIQIRRSGAESLPVLNRDVLLIQDASKSMTQHAVDRSKEGLHYWLQLLREGDRFDVLAFNDTVERAFGERTPFTALARTRAAFFIENLRAQGGTDVYASLEPLLNVDVSPDRPVIAVMVSDGVPTVGVVDSTDIIARFSEANAGRVSMFNVGGSRRVNKYLLDFLSYKNRGDAIITDEVEDLSASLNRMAVELSRPVLMDLQYRLAGAPGVDLYPRMLTHLFLDRPLVVYGRRPLNVSEAVIRVAGRSGDEVKDMVFRLAFDEAPAGDASIRTEWAWQKVYHLVGEHIRTRDPSVLREIRRMSTDYNLRVHYGTDRVPMHF